MTFIAIAITSIAIIWFVIFLKKKQDALEENFQKRFAGHTIRYQDKCAIFRAQQSSGYSQTSGKSYLVLTDTELYFKMVMFSIELSIPITSITKAESANRLLGVNPGRAMLKVNFITDDGEQDAIALNVKELYTWVKEINSLIQKA